MRPSRYYRKDRSASKLSINPHVGKRLRARRTMLGLSQKDLAEAAGVTFQQVQKYEKGANSMDASRLFELAQCLRVPISYFFADLEQSGPPPTKNDHQPAQHIPVSDRETLEIMKAIKRIDSQNVRRRLADLFRTIADSTS